MCSKSLVRMVKTIRISMDSTDLMLDTLPNLKIVHLIRDPRGVLRSRKENGYLNRIKSVKFAAINLCNRMEGDIKAMELLSKKYPGRIKRFLYEDIAANAEQAAKDLYSFLGLNFPPNMHKWILDHTSARTRNGNYGTIRMNSSIPANLWKTKLPFRTIKTIDDACEEVYKLLGYQSYN